MVRVIQMTAMCVVLLAATGQVRAEMILSDFERGEVVDGLGFGPLDGQGDTFFVDLSSVFRSSSGAPGEAQAMAYFDFAGVDTSTVTSAVFSWQVVQTFLNGPPSSVDVYAMPGNTGLSNDDFGLGTFLGSVNTSSFTAGSVLSFDVTNTVQSLSGSYLGIRLATTELNRAVNFSGTNNPQSSSIEFSTAPTVPEPTSVALFGIGALGLVATGVRRRKQKQA